MTLTIQQQNCLSLKVEEIRLVFVKYKALKDYMGVYFNTRNSKSYITFSNTLDFKPVLKMAGNTHEFCCSYICSDDFDEQTTAYLS